MTSSCYRTFNPSFMAFSSAARLSGTLIRHRLPFQHIRFSNNLNSRLSDLRLLSTLRPPFTRLRHIRAYSSAREDGDSKDQNGTLLVKDSNGDKREGRVVPTELHKEATEAYMAYAMSVLLGRALPDVRDGLKPVHRRILFAMHELGLSSRKPFKKCARVVGEVLGKFHPHGDTAVYDALVRMAQDFSLRSPLIRGHGNFGSVDADPPAAMRYTECRLEGLTEAVLLADLDLDTVDFVPNFDSSQKEPSLLPARLPTLLLNGSSGIAVGMATNIPPHNLGELVDALCALIHSPQATVQELLEYMPGPDFPTGGLIMGNLGILDAYRSGRGRIVVRGKTDIELLDPKTKRTAIIINEIPYQTNKASLVEKIAVLVEDKSLDGISDIRDESDRSGMRIVIELIEQEALELKSKFSTPRRSSIEDSDGGHLEDIDVIPNEEMLLALSEKGYVKRMKPNTFNLQNRGTVGKSVGKLRVNDAMMDSIVCRAHDHMLYFRMQNSRLGGFLSGCSNSLSNYHYSLHSSTSRRIINPFSTFLLSFSNSSFLIHRPFSGYAVEQFSDDEYECNFENHKASSSVANIDQWKWKLSLLLRSETDQEIVSKDRKDRRDYEQISGLAKRMGLYSELYGKVVVASKVPLPNYRPDLDDKRPQREVVLPLSLQRRVEGLLQEHLDRTRLSSRELSAGPADAKSVDQSEKVCQEDNSNHVFDGSVMEKVLQRRSLRMRNMQRAWQESPEGKKMIDFRRSLPSFKEKEKLLQAIARNQVIVVSGETGCGKTTQLPQYILESEIESGRGAFCSIICTQPRRISAMAVSDRVSTERGEPLGESVGYKVRLEGVKGKNTHLLFCTSGILLRRLLSDRNLNGVTHVFVDEIHERGMNEDFLLIVLKDLLPRRQDLRLILMSATLNADLFSSFFGGAPKIHIPGFTYPVRALFLEDVLEITGYKLTSFNQVDDYGQDKVWKTQKQLAPRKKKNQITALVEDTLHKSSFESYSSKARDSLASWMPDCMGFNLIEAVLCHICRKERPGAVLVFMTGWEDISCLRDQLKAHPLLGDPNRVLLVTCHGSMATAEQKLIFERPSPNVRKIVLATNMAEASITINDIVFVVDCGKAKETTYDALNNTPCLLPSWISQASARQRRGRAGRVQPGECYHLYPKCVYEAFAEYQLPELLRTPLNSLCLQIKSLQVGSIGEFLSSALQPPEPLTVQNAIDFLKMIGALDEKENLTNLGKFLSILPVDPKLGKMLIMGAIFHCFDPVLTIVSGLSVRDPFLLPQDKKDLAGTAKSRFSAKDYSDHMALVRAYEGWKDADREGSSYEYCWRNFLSAQTLQAIHSLRKQFSFILRDAGLVDTDAGINNKLSHNQSLVRAIICSGLYPGIVSVVQRETSMSFKTMDDGQVMIYANSVNARYQTIPYPWLVFGEKVKVNTVFVRDSTGVSDSVLILFGGALNCGVQAGHLKMLSGYIDFFMDPNLAECYLRLKEELDKLIQKKLEDHSIDIHKEGKYLLLAVQELVSGDQCEGRFVFGRDSKKPKESTESRFTKDGTNPKSLLQTLLMRAGHSPPKYKTKHIKTNEFRALVEFKGMQFVGKPKKNKQLAERDAAIEALAWLTSTADNNQGDDNSPPDVTENMLKLLGKRRRSKPR